MPFDYDILIAGAGPAGCAAAYDLAKAGKRVLLLDRRNFPRPKACACGLTRKTLKALRYSVDPVVERVCCEIVLQRAGDWKLEVGSSKQPPAADKSLEVRVRTRTPICAMAERERFDAFCLQQTLTAGAHFRKIDSIAELREAGGEHPTHIELDVTANGVTETLTAAALIGADGSNGQTRGLAMRAASKEPGLVGAGLQPCQGGTPSQGAPAPEGAPPADPVWYTRGFALEALVPYSVLPAPLPAGDAPHDLVFDFSPLPGGYGWLFPKGDHINIGVGAFAPAESPEQLKAVTRNLLSAYAFEKFGITGVPHITGQHLGMGGHAYVPQGRVLLTGDAAGLVDPLTGEGIHSAIVSGQAAAAAFLETYPTARGGPSVPPYGAGGNALAAAYARRLAPLQQTLAFSHRAARAFYRDPARGFQAMRLPILRSLILKTYADGLPHTRLLTALARFV